MKKFRYSALLLAFALLICSCGSKSTVIEPGTSEDITVSSTNEEKEDSKESSSVSDDKGEVSPSDTPSEEVSASEMTELSELELKYFNEYLNKDENNGFLLSTYADPRDVNLNEVFYTGNPYGYTSDEERQAYMDYYGWEEMYVGIVSIDLSYIKEKVYAKTGYSYDEMNNKLDWFYRDDTQRFYNAVSDTNYVPRKVVSGYVMNDVYVLRVADDTSAYYGTTDYYYKPDLEVALAPNDENEYKFLSVRYMLDENALEDYCFNLCVPYYGEISLMTYAPKSEDTDITFAIIHDGDYITSLWAGTNNHLEDCKFSKIMDMGFYDYNNDGFPDLLMNIEYLCADGSYNYILRVYEGSEYGYFIYMAEETEACYGCVGLDTTTKDIKAEIMYDCLSYSYSVDYSQWKSDLVNAIKESDCDLTGGVLGGGYYFVMIDDNDIPELAQVSAFPADGTVIYSTYDGTVYETRLDRLYFTYKYREGLICNSDGIANAFFDRVYEMRDGMFYLIGDGEYVYEDDNTIYYWNGETVSAEKYKASLDSVYSLNYGSPGYVSSILMSTDEVIRLLTVDVKKVYQ